MYTEIEYETLDEKAQEELLDFLEDTEESIDDIENNNDWHMESRS